MATNKIAIRQDTAANWTSENPTLDDGELGHESDTGNLKIGDGSTAWTSIPYFGAQPGDLKAFAGSSSPFGWMAANGETIGDVGSGADNEGDVYEALFDIIKDSWGNAGTEVFGDGDTVLLPDLQGAFLRGAGEHGTETMADGNPYEGPAVGEFEDDQMQGHWHDTKQVSGTSLGYVTAATIATGTGLDGWIRTPTFDDSALGARAATTDGTNGTPRTGDETRSFAAGVLWCVKI